MSARLQGKVAIVTGGASGFGLGIATKFVKEGARVIIADLSEESGRKAAKALGCEFCLTDVTKREAWEALLHKAIDTYGGPDIIVNNAGATYSNKPTVQVTDADFDLCMNVNVKSVYLSSSVLVPYFLENNKPGCFIQISSTAALRPRPNLTWYNASKAAVSNATKTMAVEYGPQKIRFNAVCPVIGSTGMTHLFLGKEDTAENRAAFVSTVPLGRPCEPKDVANACCYLASDEAKFITGVNLEDELRWMEVDAFRPLGAPDCANRDVFHFPRRFLGNCTQRGCRVRAGISSVEAAALPTWHAERLEGSRMEREPMLHEFGFSEAADEITKKYTD